MARNESCLEVVLNGAVSRSFLTCCEQQDLPCLRFTVSVCLSPHVFSISEQHPFQPEVWNLFCLLPSCLGHLQTASILARSLELILSFILESSTSPNCIHSHRTSRPSLTMQFHLGLVLLPFLMALASPSASLRLPEVTVLAECRFAHIFPKHSVTDTSDSCPFGSLRQSNVHCWLPLHRESPFLL